jgi:hypothetical protein
MFESAKWAVRTALPLPSTSMGLITCCAASSTGAATMLAVIARTAPAFTHELAQSASARPRLVAWSRRSRLQCLQCSAHMKLRSTT